MPEHFFQTRDGKGAVRFFRITIEREGDHFAATCSAVDAKGRELPDAPQAAPRFYGLDAQQALRRMVQALENSYDEVSAVRPGG